MRRTLIRRCPICASSTGTVLHHQVYVAPSELNVQPEVDIVACDRCGMCFADLLTSQDDLDDAYRDHSKYADVSLYGRQAGGGAQPPTDAPWDLQRLQGTARFLAQHVPLTARVLDAGCATGALLGYLQAEGFRQVVGLDPSPAATAIAADAYGVATVTGSFFDPPVDIGLFDVVVLSHVLEHVSDVEGAVAGMWALTRPGGSVYVEVPDASRYADYLVAPFNDFNTEHINHFSKATLQLAMELAGFEVDVTSSKIVRCSPRDDYPAIFGLYRRPERPRPSPSITRDDSLEAGLRSYRDASDQLLAEFGRRINLQVPDGPLIIWGVGQLAMKLLAGPLQHRAISAIIDTSEAKWGQHIRDLQIASPTALRDDDETPILVTSIHHLESIEASIALYAPGRTVVRLRD